MKFKKEQYVFQRQSKTTGKVTFQVRIRGDLTEVTKSFSELEYGNARTAYECAVKFKNQTLFEMTQGTLLRRSRATVKSCFELFMQTTILSYNSQVKHRKLFNKYFSCQDKKIQELTRADIVNCLNSMVDIASDETITRVLSIWRKDIIETALNNEFIQRDLTLGLKPPKSHIYSIKKDTSVSRDTILKVEDVLWNSTVHPYNCKIIVYMLEVMYYTGIRPAEAEVLTRDDIQEDFIIINKELGSDKNRSDVVRRPKTQNSIRRIPIHPSLKKVLSELFEFAKYDSLFVDENGKYMNSTAIGSMITNRIKYHGLKFNMYMLRHNLATELITNKVDEKTTMELLGHTNFSMSLYYANSNDELKSSAIKLIS